MLASLLRPKKRRVYTDRSPFSSPCTARETTPFFQYRVNGNGSGRKYGDIDNEDEDEDDDNLENGEEEVDDEDEEDEEEDGSQDSMPLLPIFSASHLDALPVYNIIHTIRSLIAARCETTLTWDQLRSPQVSQFLVKPIQQKIMTSHFSRATLYALMANALQFAKEIHLNPGNSGTSQTRAMVSELLAIKLLKEYTTRELIDALSYEFHPLQGQTPPTTGSSQLGTGWNSAHRTKRLAGAARISCLELAIRAQAKRFLAHPVVVQQLEAIWAGTIVFHSAADSLHRQPVSPKSSYGTYGGNSSISFGHASGQEMVALRRSVTLYDPRDASLFKLSRLRVPRYRQFLSTLSFAVLLGLFLAVLNERRLEITSLEVVFWFWSAGFMLDEIVGFNEQGFSLYLMSFWNVFDLGILLLLACYYCMRLYGAIMPTKHAHRVAASRAYDILAANAVLLFPRLFSILDHYRYFSQLLIAFRIMASDLISVFFLVIIACSGFFVAFMAFGAEHSPGSVAYALLQILMGFSPAAWSLWDEYNALGKIILTVFLFICHFVVVTILITVLTNSFMAIVQNANQEHQFLFAVNTISMVKSDALFSYMAPTNIFAWLITPLRYLMPFRQFIRLNRTIIKITHLPILFSICFYEKVILSSKVIEPTDLIEGNDHSDMTARPREPRRSRFHAFSPNAPRLVREPSVATFQKDRALEEVFRRPVKDETARRPTRTLQRQQSSNRVTKWMQGMDSGPAHPPDEQDPDVVNRLEGLPTRLRFPFRSRMLSGTLRDFTETTRSVASDPEELVSHAMSPPVIPRRTRDLLPPTRTRQLSRHTDIEGDDELTSDNDDRDSAEGRHSAMYDDDDDDEGVTQAPKSPGKATPKFYSSRPSTAKLMSRKNSPSRRSRHIRNYSDTTMLYNPLHPDTDAVETETNSVPIRPRAETPDVGTPGLAASADQWTMRRRNIETARVSNPQLPRSNPMSVPDLGGFSMADHQSRGHHPSVVFDMGSDLGDNKAVAGAFLGTVPASFTTQMAYATGGIRRTDMPNRDQDMLSKLVLARMNNIEEGFREVIKEVKDLRRGGSSRSQSRPDESRSGPRERRKPKEGKMRPHSSRKSKTSSEG